MKIFEIDQNTLERYVPAAKNATDEVFVQLSGSLEDAEESLLRVLGQVPDDLLANEDVCKLCVRFICQEAFFRAVPHLDLILTGSGFGIVNTSNVAPASPHRVQSLREEVRRQRSDAFDLLLEKLVGTSWAEQPHCQEYVPGLLFTAMQLRRYGVRQADGGEIYQEEYHAMAAAIREAESFLHYRYSPELYEYLVRKVLKGSCTNLESFVIERMRRLMACHIGDASPSKGKTRALNTLADELSRVLDAHVDELLVYKESSTYAANHFETYQNKAHDNTFFFS